MKQIFIALFLFFPLINLAHAQFKDIESFCQRKLQYMDSDDFSLFLNDISNESIEQLKSAKALIGQSVHKNEKFELRLHKTEIIDSSVLSVHICASKPGEYSFKLDEKEIYSSNSDNGSNSCHRLDLNIDKEELASRYVLAKKITFTNLDKEVAQINLSIDTERFNECVAHNEKHCLAVIYDHRTLAEKYFEEVYKTIIYKTMIDKFDELFCEKD